MSKIFSTVADIDKDVFDAACTAKLNSGYTPVGGVSKYGENSRKFIQGFQKDTASNTPLITVSNAQVLLNFGNVASGVPSVLPLNIVGKYITGVIAVGAPSKPQYAVSAGSPYSPDGDGNINVTPNVTFTPAGAGTNTAYIQLTTADGQTVNVIATGVGV